MTSAIDCLVNVGFADDMQPEWMVRVKEDYFKGDDSFFQSPELPELLGICDRIYALSAGRVTGEVDVATAQPEKLMQYMTSEKE